MNTILSADSKLSSMINSGKLSASDAASNSIKDMNPVGSSFSYEKYSQFAQTLLEAGYGEEEAKLESYRVQIETVVLLSKAEEYGIKVSDEEALEMAKEVRELLDLHKRDEEFVENNKEAMEYTQALIEGIGITEDQYWNEYVINGYKYTIALEKLSEIVMEEARQNSLPMDWSKYIENLIKEYEKENKREVKN